MSDDGDDRMSGHYPGQRLSFHDSLCTVRYCGPLPAQTGDWLGVEWDEQDRGKHHGQYKGRRVFDTLSPSPNCASFIRPTRQADPSRSFLEALKYKYADERAERATDDTIEISGKVVEEVGFDRIRRQQAVLQELRIVVLDRLRVRGIGNEEETGRVQDEIARTCPTIAELDLSGNLLESWDDIAAICAPLEKLRCLKVSGLRLRTRDVGVAFHAPKLEELHLNDCLLPSAQILAMLCRQAESSSLELQFPSLHTLSVAGNNLCGLGWSESKPMAPVFETVKTLVLDSNAFTSLAPTCRSLLQLFPNLCTLSLQHNQISAFDTGPGAPKGSTPAYPSITALNLSHNAVTTPAFISSLPPVFPNLLSLRVSGNPFFTTSPSAEQPHQRSQDAVFMLTLARVPTLTTLNYSTIASKDRMDAELYYVSVAEQAIQQASQSNRSRDHTDVQNAMRNWLRYEELCSRYERENMLQKLLTSTGAYTSNASTGQTECERSSRNRPAPGSLGAQLITIEFQLESNQVDDDDSNDNNDDVSTTPDRSLTLTLPPSISIYGVKGLLLRKTGGDWGLKPLDFVLESLGRRRNDDDDDGPTGQVDPEIIPDSTRGIGDWIRRDDGDGDEADNKDGRRLGAWLVRVKRRGSIRHETDAAAAAAAAAGGSGISDVIKRMDPLDLHELTVA